MRTNRIETVLANSAPRRWLQRAAEVPMLPRLGGQMAVGTALKIGCGQGAGTEPILEPFVPTVVVGIDLDETMIARARRRLAGPTGAEVPVGDAAAIDLRHAGVDGCATTPPLPQPPQ